MRYIDKEYQRVTDSHDYFRSERELSKRRSNTRKRLLRFVAKHATVHELKEITDRILKDYKRADAKIRAMHKDKGR